MPNIHTMRESKYLKKEDCGAGITMTIRICTQENLAMAGHPPELKWVVYFDEAAKGMVLNPVNAESIAEITGQDDSDNWPGRKVVLYSEPNVYFQGKKVGGIRVRSAGIMQVTPASAAPQQTPPPQYQHGQPGYQPGYQQDLVSAQYQQQLQGYQQAPPPATRGQPSGTQAPDQPVVEDDDDLPF